MMKAETTTRLFLMGLIIGLLSGNALAQQQESAESSTAEAASETTKADDNQAERFEKFTKLLTNAKLTGHFTVDGRALDKLNPETYEILSVKKLDEGDYWQFRTRVKYGDKDVVVPLALEVKWADDTPMITLTNLRIPLIGQGEFGARVLFYDNKYCGTWSHGKVTGHLFGKIDHVEPEKKDDE